MVERVEPQEKEGNDSIFLDLTPGFRSPGAERRGVTPRAASRRFTYSRVAVNSRRTVSHQPRSIP